jgi:hypothetical protein
VILSGSLVILSGSLVILSGSLVILSEAKDLAWGSQTLRYAQHDTTGFGRYSSLSRTPPIYRPGERTDRLLADESAQLEHPSIF